VTDDSIQIDADLVARLVAGQFPQWADLPVRTVNLQGWDNRTFRLGEELSVRLPSAPGYAPQVEKEHRWLPRLAPHLPLPIPIPIARGRPAEGYPLDWSVYRWLPGTPLATTPIADLSQLAADLAHFLAALYRIDASDGPPAGPHSFYRGGPLSVYDAETREAIATLRDEIDADAATAIWEEALAAEWDGPPVWVHGDVAVGNLLMQDGRLSAVIDFGSSAVGDPSCDTVIAWTFFTEESREVFRRKLPVDPNAWTRGRGWALWKALITLAGSRDTDPAKADHARRTLGEVLINQRHADM
jgi:aminoglycoside phosphotransferase (APT) family kinase protein